MTAAQQAPDGAATPGASVEFRHVTKRYDTGTTGPGAVNDLSMTIPAGRICVLVGPSGCGKTTSLKMVNRLIEPTSGQILVDGRDIAQEDPIALRRRIGYVIQQVGLFPHQTIGTNVATVPGLLGWDERRKRERTDELLELVGLDPARYRDRYPAQLSGGERQRVGVARALAVDPPVLLMDEPFGAVDPIVRQHLQDELLRLQARLARTILFVTHDIDEAIRLGDLVAVYQSGGILAQLDTPDAILSAPASDFVARFVGVDRGLKRLSLSRVRDLTPTAAPTARVGDDAAEARERTLARPDSPWLLLLDARGRPLGWVHERRIPRDGVLAAGLAEPTTAILTPWMSLRDALSVMLDEEVVTGVVVDAEGRATGALTIEQLASALR
ncbi:MAG: ABC transporter ATP-binding protein [Chloroflexota bacterium]